jgi:hypothetical protein
MINREDLLELTRRMTVARNCMTRIAGAYVNSEGEIDDTFNVNFLNLRAAEKKRCLEIAKQVPFAETNVKLKEFSFPKEARGKDSIYMLLNGMLECHLKNDALLDVFYEQMIDAYPVSYDTAIYVCTGSYDVPSRTRNGEIFGDSELVYDFLICTISPMLREYEPDRPDFGFLYPAFSDGCGDLYAIDIFRRDPVHIEDGIDHKLFGR